MTEKMTKRIKIHANDKIGSSSYFMPVNDLLSGHDSKHGVVWCTFYFSKNLFFFTSTANSRMSSKVF